VQLKNVVVTRLADEDYAFIRRLADQEERRPSDVLRRIVIAAKKQTAPDRQDRGAVALTSP
jgi:hypothetical protein